MPSSQYSGLAKCGHYKAHHRDHAATDDARDVGREHVPELAVILELTTMVSGEMRLAPPQPRFELRLYTMTPPTT